MTEKKENIIYCPNKTCGKIVYRNANFLPRDGNEVVGEIRCANCGSNLEIVFGYFARPVIVKK
jgi:hypothetical protein